MNIYEGYLFRVGLITEWYHVKDVLNWTQPDSMSVTVRVSTSDPKGRVIVVHIGSFVGERQFSMNAMVEGEDASERYNNAYTIKLPNKAYICNKFFNRIYTSDSVTKFLIKCTQVSRYLIYTTFF